jgi:hypothetical protein
MLTPHELDILDQLLACVLPSASGPGATEARAIEYVAARLSAETPEMIGALREGIRRAPTPSSRAVEASVLPTCRDLELGVIVWSPLVRTA